MRILVVLVALVIIGWLLVQRLDETGRSDPASTAGDTSTPRVPDQPSGVQEFEQDMDAFIREQDQQQRQRMEDAGG